MKTFLLTIVLLFLIIVSAFTGAHFKSDMLGVGLAFISIFLVFKVYDAYNPAPRNLSKDEIKSFFQSKIFWAAFLNLVIVMLQGLFKFTVGEGAAEMILSLDWSMLPQALISVVIIVLRKTDLLKFLN